MINPIIKVICYKDTGKYYASKETELKDIHYSHCPVVNHNSVLFDILKDKMQDLQQKNYQAIVRLIDAIKCDHTEVQEYAPVTSGFKGNFYYTIEVLYLDNEIGFCNFHIDNIKPE